VLEVHTLHTIHNPEPLSELCFMLIKSHTMKAKVFVSYSMLRKFGINTLIIYTYCFEVVRYLFSLPKGLPFVCLTHAVRTLLCFAEHFLLKGKNIYVTAHTHCPIPTVQHLSKE
jgi:hypothetical protein